MHISPLGALVSVPIFVNAVFVVLVFEHSYVALVGFRFAFETCWTGPVLGFLIDFVVQRPDHILQVAEARCCSGSDSSAPDSRHWTHA